MTGFLAALAVSLLCFATSVSRAQSVTDDPTKLRPETTRSPVRKSGTSELQRLAREWTKLDARERAALLQTHADPGDREKLASLLDSLGTKSVVDPGSGTAGDPGAGTVSGPADPGEFDDEPGMRSARRLLALAELEAAQAQQEYAKAALEERRSVVSTTNRIGYGVAFVVHGIVLFGVWAAWREFRYASRRRSSQPEKETELSINIEGIALKSTLHGLLLLGASFGFYLAYLVLVYPVETLP